MCARGRNLYTMEKNTYNKNMRFLLVHDLVFDGRRPAIRVWNLVIYNVQLLNKAVKRHTKYDIISDARTLDSNAELGK